MNRYSGTLLRALATAALGSPLLAQNPVDPPPWWGVQDEVTVSLYWDFSGPAPFTPLQVAVPPWYNPAVTQGLPTGPLTIIPALAGHTDVLGLVGNGTPLSATFDLTVDNDPHLDWIKVFWFQFDEFEGASGAVIEAIEQDLTKYKRSSVTTTSVAIGNGWNRVTVTAQLVPQPDDEGIDWTFTETALGNAAIDNLFVNSKCIKVDDSDQDGDAFGEPDGFSVDVSAQASGDRCIAAGVTTGPAPQFVRSYWVSVLSPSAGTPHRLMRLNQAGLFVSATPLSATAATAPNGASDLAVATIPSAVGQPQQLVYAIVDQRTTPGGNVVLFAFNDNGAPVPALDVVLTAFPALAPQRFGLAYNRHGDGGNGSFLVTDQAGNAFEFGRLTGALLPPIVTGLPTGIVGAGYDDVFGNYYWFSNTPLPTPSGPVQVNGFEWSGYDLQPTGARFFGDLTLPNPGGLRGGVASGLDVYRRASGDFRMLCIVQMQTHSRMYELKGPFRWGASLEGSCGMQGLPFEGSNNFTLTLDGVPNAVFAALYVGFAPRPVPFPLTGFGMPETNVLINLDMNSTLQVPTAPGSGSFVFNFPQLPIGSGFSYVPLFFQWVVFDPSAPNGVSMSKAGKTILY